MKMTKEQQYAVLAVVLLLIVGAIYYQFLLKPVYANIAQLTTTLQQKEKDLQDAKAIVAKYAEFKKRSASIQRELEWFQNRIPASIDRVKMLDALSEMQSRSGLRLTDFRSDAQPVKKDKYTEVPVTVRFISDYRQLLEFIHQMAFTDTLLTVRGISLNRRNEASSPSDPTLTGEMTVKGAMANAAAGAGK